VLAQVGIPSEELERGRLELAEKHLDLELERTLKLVREHNLVELDSEQMSTAPVLQVYTSSEKHLQLWADTSAPVPVHTAEEDELAHREAFPQPLDHTGWVHCRHSLHPHQMLTELQL
jgi:hypothetical protein